MNPQKTPWVLQSVFKESTSVEDLQNITPKITQLVDKWQSQGTMIWSGAFDDNKTGMAVFEGTLEEANQFFKEYSEICSDVLEYSLHNWDAMPILSLLT